MGSESVLVSFVKLGNGTTKNVVGLAATLTLSVFRRGEGMQHISEAFFRARCEKEILGAKMTIPDHVIIIKQPDYILNRGKSEPQFFHETEIILKLQLHSRYIIS